MANLSNVEKRGFEKIFGMESGYVLDFSDRTFREFIVDSTGINIYDTKYSYASGSKANRLRAFWTVESNYIAAKLLDDLLKYVVQLGIKPENKNLLESCLLTVKRLLQSVPVTEIEAITPNTAGKDFEILAKSVREAIEKNEPESGLDRLHTFIVKYIRVLCEKNGIGIEKDKPLHSLMGEYIKRIKDSGKIESEMTERILKSNISILESFNRVRNDQSFAHDNQILNYDECLLIFNHVSSLVRFIESLERQNALSDKQPIPATDISDDLPF